MAGLTAAVVGSGSAAACTASVSNRNPRSPSFVSAILEPPYEHEAEALLRGERAGQAPAVEAELVQLVDVEVRPLEHPVLVAGRGGRLVAGNEALLRELREPALDHGVEAHE